MNPDNYTPEWDYIRAEKLDDLINFDELNEGAVIDSEIGGCQIPIPPNPLDLVRLHKLVRQRKCFTVLEFGVGHSTIVLADALKKNEIDWNQLKDRPPIRNRFMFQLFSIDASLKWIKRTKQLFPKLLIDRTHIKYSRVEIGTFRGQLCHYYKTLWDIIPDFIYLDGPSPKDVRGDLHGLSFQCNERTVMSGDLLLMEPTFLPGLLILVDGRTNNCRFLQRNFTRKYEVREDKNADITTFELLEERLGKYNLLGSDFL